MSFTIYHNPRCKKSRAGLAYLESKGIEAEVRNYFNDPLSMDEMKVLLSKLNLPAQEIVRTQEEAWRKGLKGKNFTQDEWIHIILENPKLLKRPIVVRDNKAIWADPAEKIDQLL